MTNSDELTIVPSQIDQRKSLPWGIFSTPHTWTMKAENDINDCFTVLMFFTFAAWKVKEWCRENDANEHHQTTD